MSGTGKLNLKNSDLFQTKNAQTDIFSAMACLIDSSKSMGAEQIIVEYNDLEKHSKYANGRILSKLNFQASDTIAIVDNGRGMDSHEIEHLFEKNRLFQSSMMQLGETAMVISQTGEYKFYGDESKIKFKVAVLNFDKNDMEGFCEYAHLSMLYNKETEKVENESLPDEVYEKAYVAVQKMSPFRSKHFRGQFDKCLTELNDVWKPSGSAVFIYSCESKFLKNSNNLTKADKSANSDNCTNSKSDLSTKVIPKLTNQGFDLALKKSRYSAYFYDRNKGYASFRQYLKILYKVDELRIWFQDSPVKAINLANTCFFNSNHQSSFEFETVGISMKCGIPIDKQFTGVYYYKNNRLILHDIYNSSIFNESHSNYLAVVNTDESLNSNSSKTGFIDSNQTLSSFEKIRTEIHLKATEFIRNIRSVKESVDKSLNNSSTVTSFSNISLTTKINDSGFNEDTTSRPSSCYNMIRSKPRKRKLIITKQQKAITHFRCPKDIRNRPVERRKRLEQKIRIVDRSNRMKHNQIFTYEKITITDIYISINFTEVHSKTGSVIRIMATETSFRFYDDSEELVWEVFFAGLNWLKYFDQAGDCQSEKARTNDKTTLILNLVSNDFMTFINSFGLVCSPETMKQWERENIPILIAINIFGSLPQLEFKMLNLEQKNRVDSVELENVLYQFGDEPGEVVERILSFHDPEMMETSEADPNCTEGKNFNDSIKSNGQKSKINLFSDINKNFKPKQEYLNDTYKQIS